MKECLQHEADLLEVQRQRDALATALERLLFFWTEYTSQEMYGEHLRDGLGGDFDPWDDAHEGAREALRSIGKHVLDAAPVAPKEPQP